MCEEKMDNDFEKMVDHITNREYNEAVKYLDKLIDKETREKQLINLLKVKEILQDED